MKNRYDHLVRLNSLRRRSSPRLPKSATLATMATSGEVIVLSSSPNPSPQTPTRKAYGPQRIFDISPRGESPQSIPSPSQLFNSPPSRSRFFPTPTAPQDAAKKRVSITKKPSLSTVHDDFDIVKPKSKVASTKSKTNPAEKAGSKSQDSTNEVPKKSKTAPKVRPKTITGKKETGNMILSGKITKGVGEERLKKPSKAKKKTTVESECPQASTDQETNQGPEAATIDKELHLEEALRRRTDWTPPRDTCLDIPTAAAGEEIVKHCDGPAIHGGFDKILSAYNYSGPSAAVPEIVQNVGEGPTKRRRIELVTPLPQPFHVYQNDSNGEATAQETDSSSSSARTKKNAKGPKRLTTLTARMTAQYTRTNTNQHVLTSDESQATRKPKSKRGKGRMTENETEFTVLSPDEAFRSLENQDLVFGTCSQLEREESPHTLQELEQAIRASEDLAFNGNEQTAVAKAASKSAVSCLTGTRNLWEVAARDSDGSLVQARKINTIAQEKDTKVKRPVNWEDEDWFELDYGMPNPPSKKKQSSSEKVSDSTTDLSLSGSREPLIQTADDATEKTAPIQNITTQQPQMPQYSGFTDTELAQQISKYGFKSVRGRKKMIDLLQKCWESKHGSSNKTAPVSSQRPLLPETETAKPSGPAQSKDQSVTAEKGMQKKPVRSKTQSKKPIVSKQKAPLSSAQTAIPKEAMAVSSPKTTPKPAKRRSQALPRSFIDVEEIQDSEDESISSPSQVQKRYINISTSCNSATEPFLDIQTKEITESSSRLKTTAFKPANAAKSLPEPDKTASSKRSSLPDLASQITKAVRSQPLLSPLSSSSGSRSRPTWHEKILMFDPIILEDFTTWLNVEGLGLVGEDREIHAAMAREWCESKGICCCWKNNATW